MQDELEKLACVCATRWAVPGGVSLVCAERAGGRAGGRVAGGLGEGPRDTKQAFRSAWGGTLTHIPLRGVSEHRFSKAGVVIAALVGTGLRQRFSRVGGTPQTTSGSDGKHVCCPRERREMLLASGGWRPEMLLGILLCPGQSPPQNRLAPDGSTAEAENSGLRKCST